MPEKKQGRNAEEQSAAFKAAVAEMTERGDFDVVRAQRALDHVVKTRLADSPTQKVLDSKAGDK